MAKGQGPLRYALLGLLAGSPGTGYALRKRFAIELADAWYAETSQIYPELARLVEDGLISEISRGPRGAKTYAITDAGLEKLVKWLRETEPAANARARGSRPTGVVESSRLAVVLTLETEPPRALAVQRSAPTSPIPSGPLPPGRRMAAVCRSDEMSKRQIRFSKKRVAQTSAGPAVTRPVPPPMETEPKTLAVPGSIRITLPWKSATQSEPPASAMPHGRPPVRIVARTRGPARLTLMTRLAIALQ